jgi:hypothetical protein
MTTWAVGQSEADILEPPATSGRNGASRLGHHRPRFLRLLLQSDLNHSEAEASFRGMKPFRQSINAARKAIAHALYPTFLALLLSPYTNLVDLVNASTNTAAYK